MTKFLVFCLGVAFAVGAMFCRQLLSTQVQMNGANADAMACIRANMTWTPSYDRYGAFVGIRCNPSVPYIAPIEQEG